MAEVEVEVPLLDGVKGPEPVPGMFKGVDIVVEFVMTKYSDISALVN
jgi:hypothetical protein